MNEIKKVRKPLGKKLRFEVFKRDGFTCQYCGRMAPTVVLEVDHINPVKEKGTDNIMNLITSCFDCNRGKGCKTLSDNQVIKQQQDQLKEINEKRVQLQLMLKWKKELEKFDNEQVDIIEDIIEKATDNSFTETGRQNMIKTIKKYGINEVIEATESSLSQYFVKGNDVQKVVQYIPKICKCKKASEDNPWLYKGYYIKAIMKNRFGIYNESRTNTMLRNLVVDKNSYDIVCNIAKDARNWSQFWELIDEACGN